MLIRNPSVISVVRVRAPLVTDSGHALNTVWHNSLTGDKYICMSNAPGAAVWRLFSSVYYSYFGSDNEGRIGISATKTVVEHWNGSSWDRLNYWDN